MGVSVKGEGTQQYQVAVLKLLATRSYGEELLHTTPIRSSWVQPRILAHTKVTEAPVQVLFVL